MCVAVQSGGVGTARGSGTASFCDGYRATFSAMGLLTCFVGVALRGGVGEWRFADFGTVMVAFPKFCLNPIALLLCIIKSKWQCSRIESYLSVAYPAPSMICEVSTSCCRSGFLGRYFVNALGCELCFPWPCRRNPKCWLGCRPSSGSPRRAILSRSS